MDVVKPLSDDGVDTLRKAQLADPVVGPVLRGKETGDRPSPSLEMSLPAATVGSTCGEWGNSLSSI